MGAFSHLAGLKHLLEMLMTGFFDRFFVDVEGAHHVRFV